MDRAEKKWIKKLDTFKNGYNSTEGGSGNLTGPLKKRIGIPRSRKVRERISRSLKGRVSFRKFTDEQMLKMIALYKLGFSFEKIGVMFNSKSGVIWKIVSKQTIPSMALNKESYEEIKKQHYINLERLGING